MISITPQSIRSFLLDSAWLERVESVEFLAAGEYNENYLVHTGGDAFVFRINRGSQLDLEDQITYEYNVLEAVKPSGCTPVPYRCHPSDDTFPGALLMGFIPGRSFSYSPDDRKAAVTLARIHALPVGSAAEPLIRQPDAVASIVEESIGLLEKQPEHPLRDVKRRLLSYSYTLQSHEGIFLKRVSDEVQCIVNTELNSGNFIVRDEDAFLVDWEKAVISNRYQDLGHYLVPTTTLWKSDYRYDTDSRRSFLRIYLAQSDVPVDLDELCERTAIMERVILLRALSWCYMAYYEYTKTDRPLSNDDTFSRIRWYLEEIEWFLR